MTRVLVLNGPNLGRLGVREPEVYGSATHADLVAAVAGWAAALGLDVEVRQTDDESVLVGWLHEAVDARAHVVLNPAAFTHYSYALRDAAAQVTHAGLVLVEVHLSNPYARRRSGTSGHRPDRHGHDRRASASTATTWRSRRSPPARPDGPRTAAPLVRAPRRFAAAEIAGSGHSSTGISNLATELLRRGRPQPRSQRVDPQRARASPP